MSLIKEFEDLECWRLARVLTNRMLDISSRTSMHFQFRLKDQIAGASISIMNNIAEGFNRSSNKEFVRFLDIAIASASELKSMSYLLLDRLIIDQKEFTEILQLIGQVIKIMRGLIRRLQTKI